MLPDPLHPMSVHLPLALAVLMPFVALGMLFARQRGWLPDRSWFLVVLLQVVLAGSAFVALETGEHEEDRVEPLVAERFIEQHEEAAEVFFWGCTIALALAVLVLAVPKTVPRAPIAWAACLAMVVVGGLSLRVGKAGGELVYRHGAASAYLDDSSATRGLESMAPSRHSDHDEADEEGEEDG